MEAKKHTETVDHQAEISISELIFETIFSQKNKFILFAISGQIGKKNFIWLKLDRFWNLISHSYKT